MRHDRTTLLDLALAARSIREPSDGLDREAFLVDRRAHLAILHERIRLGEAAKRLSPGGRARAREVPWRRLGGMRDKLVHGYDLVNLERVWVTVQEDVPGLAAEVERQLGEEDGDAERRPAENAGASRRRR